MSSFQKYIATLLTILVAAIVAGIGYFIFHESHTAVATPSSVTTPVQTASLPPLDMPQYQKNDENGMDHPPVQVQEHTQLNHRKGKPKMTQKDVDKCVDRKIQGTKDFWNDPDRMITHDELEEFEEDCKKGIW